MTRLLFALAGGMTFDAALYGVLGAVLWHGTGEAWVLLPCVMAFGESAIARLWRATANKLKGVAEEATNIAREQRALSEGVTNLLFKLAEKAFPIKAPGGRDT